MQLLFSVSVLKNIVISSLVVFLLAVCIDYGARLFSFSRKEAVLFSFACTTWLLYPVFIFLVKKERDTHLQNAQEKTTQLVETILLKQNDVCNESLDTRWLKVLKANFTPDKVIKTHDPTSEGVRIKKRSTLCVPLLQDSDYKYHLCRTVPEKHHFVERDKKTVFLLRQLVMLGTGVMQAQQNELLKERKQLAKDIHDDLSAKLLSILRQSNADQKHMVMEALTDLRNILNQLDVKDVYLQEVFSDIRREMKSRVAFYDTNFVWDVNIPEVYNVKVNTQVNSNLRRIFREATTNALKYMQNERIETQIGIDRQGFLSIAISNEGIAIPHEFGSGRGLGNIVSRADMINGHVNWVKNDHSFQLFLLINLEATNQSSDS